MRRGANHIKRGVSPVGMVILESVPCIANDECKMLHVRYVDVHTLGLITASYNSARPQEFAIRNNLKLNAASISCLVVDAGPCCKALRPAVEIDKEEPGRVRAESVFECAAAKRNYMA